MPSNMNAGTTWTFWNRVRGDLGRAAASTQPLTGDRDSIHAAQRNISTFQQQRAGTNYDPADLVSAIAALQQVVDSNTMPEMIGTCLWGTCGNCAISAHIM